MSLTLEYPDVFVAGAVDGHRLRHTGPWVLWSDLLTTLDYVLDERNSDYTRWRAGEYTLGVAAGWILDRP